MSVWRGHASSTQPSLTTWFTCPRLMNPKAMLNRRTNSRGFRQAWCCMALALLPSAALGDAGEAVDQASAESAELQGIEQALGQTSSPLDAVVIDIEHAEYEQAQAFLGPYLRALESARHRYHPDLVQPLTLLGDAQFGQGDYDGALESYAMAVQISRVSNGLFTPEQLEAVYKQSEALQRLGDAEQAANREQYAFEILLKAHGPDSLALLPGIYRLARWQIDAYNIFAARNLFERALKIYAANGQSGTAATMPALRGLIESYRMERFPSLRSADRDNNSTTSLSTRFPNPSVHSFDNNTTLNVNNFPVAERALQEIIRILQADPDIGPMPVSEAILDLADWHLLWEHFRKASTLYEYVYSRLEKVESADAAAYFAKPKLLYLPVPKKPRPPPASQRAEETTGFVEVAFQISPTGNVQGVKVLESEPEGMMDLAVRRSLRSARYRPAMTDGKATPFAGAVYRHAFTYFPRTETDDDA